MKQQIVIKCKCITLMVWIETEGQLRHIMGVFDNFPHRKECKFRIDYITKKDVKYCKKRKLFKNSN